MTTIIPITTSRSSSGNEEENVSSFYHCRGNQCWEVSSLWEKSKDLPPFYKNIEEFGYDFNRDHWFTFINEKGDSMIQIPTLKSLVYHFNRISFADIHYPIILCPEGKIMDGVHRLAKYRLLNQSKVLCVQFKQLPLPSEFH